MRCQVIAVYMLPGRHTRIPSHVLEHLLAMKPSPTFIGCCAPPPQQAMFDLHHDIMFFVLTVLGLVFYMTFQVGAAGMLQLHALPGSMFCQHDQPSNLYL